MRFIRVRGLVDYQAAHQIQRELVRRRIDDTCEDTVLILEHKPVITVGRRVGARDNILDAGDTPVVEVERGGDVTWHGPGQLVAYPIIALQGPRRDLMAHLRNLESAVIQTLEHINIVGIRDDRNTGVWLESNDGGLPKKVCSIGIACRRWVTSHGLALNVSCDLPSFATIHPCGFEGGIMTSIESHFERTVLVESLIPPLVASLSRFLHIENFTFDERYEGEILLS